VLLVVEFCFHCYLVGWFSLRLRWGGLPVALVLSAVANFLCGLIFVLLFHQAALFIFTFFLGAITFQLRQAFHDRLIKVAEED
jgi:hypothetical protein